MIIWRDKKPKEPRFNAEEHLEICRARERLLSFKSKIENYPAYLSEIPPEPLPSIQPEHRLFKKLQEVDGKLNNTRMILQQHLNPKKKRNTYTIV